jgi:hypothetical protein
MARFDKTIDKIVLALHGRRQGATTADMIAELGMSDAHVRAAMHAASERDILRWVYEAKDYATNRRRYWLKRYAPKVHGEATARAREMAKPKRSQDMDTVRGKKWGKPITAWPTVVRPDGVVQCAAGCARKPVEPEAYFAALPPGRYPLHTGHAIERALEAGE